MGTIGDCEDAWTVAAGTSASEERELLNIALEHARAWMILHADQRLRALNFWLIAVAFFTTAYVTTVTAQPGLALAVALMAMLVSLGFQRLERRTRDLVKRAEQALAPVERRLAAMTGVEALRLVARSDQPIERLTSYGVVIRCIQWLAIAAFAAAALYAAARAR